MNSLQPCTGYLPSTIAGSPGKRYSISSSSITPILPSGFRTRPCSYQGGRRSWSAFTNANNKERTIASEPPHHHHGHAADRGDLAFARHRGRGSSTARGLDIRRLRTSVARRYSLINLG